MGDEPDAADRRTTTIQITNEIWAALDRRKERGESFDDVIRRLIEATGVGVGAIKEPQPGEPEIIGGPVEDADADEDCMHYDVIDGETCGDGAVAKQEMRYGEGDDNPTTFYYCEEHAPE